MDGLRYRPGTWMCLVRDSVMCLLPPDTGEDRVRDIWSLLETAPRMDQVFSAVSGGLSGNLADMPSFGVLFLGERLHVLLRGPLELRQAGQDEPAASGEYVTTWSERVLRPVGPFTLRITAPDGADTAAGSGQSMLLPLERGAALVSVLEIGAPAAGAPAARPAQAVPAAVVPASAVPAPAEPASVVPASAGPVPSAPAPADPSVPAPSGPVSAVPAPTALAAADPAPTAPAPSASVSAVPAPAPPAPSPEPPPLDARPLEQDPAPVRSAAPEDRPVDLVELVPETPETPERRSPVQEDGQDAAQEQDLSETVRPLEEPDVLLDTLQPAEVSVPPAPPAPSTALIDSVPWLRGSGAPAASPPAANTPVNVPRPAPAPAAPVSSAAPASPATAAPMSPAAPAPAAPAPSSAPSPAAPAPAPVPSPEDLDHDGDTIMSSELPKAAPAPAADSRPNTSPTVLARTCPQGHANPPTRSVCALCGQQLGEEPQPVSRPPLGRAVFSTGQVEVLDRNIVVGRQPSVARTPGAEMPRMVQVPSSGGDISRSHAEVRLEGWHVMLRDLNSTNGTVLVRSGQLPHRLGQGEGVIVLDGDTAELGEDVWIRFEGLA